MLILQVHLGDGKVIPKVKVEKIIASTETVTSKIESLLKLMYPGTLWKFYKRKLTEKEEADGYLVLSDDVNTAICSKY